MRVKSPLFVSIITKMQQADSTFLLAPRSMLLLIALGSSVHRGIV
jgi:hypothetical protein